MAASEDDILRDQGERSGLQKAIADVETALPVSTPGTRRVLENSLEGMKGRVATLDKKIGEAIKQREVQAQEQAATIAAQAQKEARLSESEKQIYSSFLAKEFFTKQDFKSMDQFYSKSWDRLSDDGKEEMSHRFWEGIRHNEYRFEDAPSAVREKEEKMAYKKLMALSRDSDIQNIPSTDRDEFLEAYRTGKHETASHILSRDSFKQNMSLDTSAGAKHKAARVERAADNNVVLGEKPSAPTASQSESSAMTSLQQNAAALKGLSLIETNFAPTTAGLPNAVTPGVNGRSPS